MLDVDYFKLYNDTYGHPAGDSVLQKVAEVLLSVTARAGELAVRMGGEEFMLILPGATQRDVMNIAEVIQKRLADAAIEHRTSPIASILTVSQGVVSCVPQLHSEAADMIEAADKALYSSKNSGRNRATLSPYEP
jgi:diguanylate cyclase (GGDEF)-like protein